MTANEYLQAAGAAVLPAVIAGCITLAATGSAAGGLGALVAAFGLGFEFIRMELEEAE